MNIKENTMKGIGEIDQKEILFPNLTEEERKEKEKRRQQEISSNMTKETKGEVKRI